MKTWMPDASDHFEAWLGRVRLSLGGDARVNADEIAQDLRAHVHAELADSPDPVTIPALERVLDGLGNPASWSEPPAPTAKPKRDWFRTNVSDAFATGQKRLADGLALPLILVALTGLGLLQLVSNDVASVFLIGMAFLIARAHVIHAPHQVTGRRRWAFYLPLAIVLGALAGVVLAFPVVLAGRGGDAWTRIWTLGAWWVFVGFVTGREPKRVRAVLRPFADTFEPSHARVLMLIGIAFFIAGTVMMLAGGSVDLD